MTDETKIEPALSAEEWARVLPQPSVVAYFAGALAGISEAEGRYAALFLEEDRRHAIIAIENAALTDSDPRKITREKIEALRSIIESAQERTLDPEPASRAFLDALESYLPPERG